MDVGGENMIQMTPGLPLCSGETDALPLIPTIGDNLEDLSAVNLGVLENSPLIEDFSAGKANSDFNALLPADNSFQENSDSLAHVFSGNSFRNVITGDRILTKGLPDPSKTFPHQNENANYKSCNVDQLPQSRNKELDDQDHEVVIPVNILKLLQDEDENDTVTAADNKRDGILDFLTSENNMTGTEYAHTPKISQVNILQM